MSAVVSIMTEQQESNWDSLFTILNDKDKMHGLKYDPNDVLLAPIPCHSST